MVELGCNRTAETDESDDDDDELGNGAGYIPSGHSHLGLGDSDFEFDLVSNRIPAFALHSTGRHMHLSISRYPYEAD
jgi:hypothetical protein